MRELFIYYRSPMERAGELAAAALAMQAALRERHPGLATRLLRRPEAMDGLHTWMETYATDPTRAPQGVDTTLEGAIADAALVLAPLITGRRHVEVFDSCAS